MQATRFWRTVLVGVVALAALSPTLTTAAFAAAKDRVDIAGKAVLRNPFTVADVEVKFVCGGGGTGHVLVVLAQPTDATQGTVTGAASAGSFVPCDGQGHEIVLATTMDFGAFQPGLARAIVALDAPSGANVAQIVKVIELRTP